MTEPVGVHMERTTRDQSIDVLRFLAFMGVVCIHTVHDRATMGLAEAGRFAVPFFFALSGYFLADRYATEPGKIILRTAKRLVPLYVFWVAVYLLWHAMINQGAVGGFSVASIVFTGGPGYHLWFLPSLLAATVAFIILRQVLSWPATALVAVVAYCACTVIGSYGSLLSIPEGIDVRVGPAYGLAFVAFGRWVSEAKPRSSQVIAIGACALFLVANVGELALIKALGRAGALGGIPDARFATLPLGCCVLVAGTSHLKFLKHVPILAYLGKLSLGMYAVHLLWVQIIDYAGLTKLMPSVVLPVVVVLLSTFTAYVGAKTPLRRFFI